MCTLTRLEGPIGGISDPVDRLKYTMKEHLLHIAPSNIDARPKIKKRGNHIRNKILSEIKEGKYYSILLLILLLLLLQNITPFYVMK